jgi:hypothetical protein
MTARKPNARKPIVLDLRQIYSRCQEDGDCLLWTQATSSHGTPYAQHNGSVTNVRRLTWTLQHDMPIRHKQQITSLCGNARCLSPDHLRARTVSEVHQAMADMGRYKSSVSSAKKALARRNGSRWTMDTARDIRADERTLEAIAKHYGMSKANCWSIKAGRTWRENVGSVFAGLA